MSGWLWALLLAGLAGVGLLRWARPPKGVWELVVAALLAGVAGYAWQGTPGLAGAPRSAAAPEARFDAAAAQMRAAMTDRFGPATSWLAMSDGLARSGDSEDGANVLLSGLRAAPRDATLWIALGNALLQHQEGVLSPAAEYAYRQALRHDARGYASRYFYGMALARAGRLQPARTLWAEAVARLPENAEVRADLVAKIAMIDQAEAPARPAPAAP